MSNIQGHNYYTGGLAELVPTPTVLTYSFLKHWFTGTGSLGKAMKLMHMPYTQSDVSVFDSYEKELVIDLSHEELILYEKTIFTYKLQKNIHQTPQLTVDYLKFFNPMCLLQTVRIIL